MSRILIVLFVFLFSCKMKNDSTIEKLNVEETFYSNGSPKSVCYFKDDSNSLCISFDDSTNINKLENYTNGKKNGWEITYFSNYIVKSKAQYKNDVLEGKMFWYYLNSCLKSQSNWRNGKQLGEALFFDTLSNIKKYNVTDFNGNLRYIRTYNSDGKVIEEKGSLICQLLLDAPSFDSLKIHEEVTIIICVATPPKCHVRVKIGEIDIKGFVNDFTDYEITQNLVNFSTSFKEEGSHSIMTIVDMTDSLEVIKKSDTLITDFTVIETSK